MTDVNARASLDSRSSRAPVARVDVMSRSRSRALALDALTRALGTETRPRVSARGARAMPRTRTMTSEDASSSLSVAAFAIWGANTGVGKTLACAGLARAARALGTPTTYLKPVQTGFPEDSDAEFVARRVGGMSTVGEHAAAATSSKPSALGFDASVTRAHTEFAWRRAAGPHLTVAEEGRGVSDEEIVRATRKYVREFAESAREGASRALALIETAGGVASPGPSGTLQCELLRALRLPAILVGDGRLGGISTTTAAFESLHARGYDIVGVVLADDGLGNHKALASILPSGTKVVALPPLPPEGQADAWLEKSKDAFAELLKSAMEWHENRVKVLRSLPDEAIEKFWWPFTQHAMVERDNVTVIDGRYGDDFEIFDSSLGGDGAIDLRFDGAASWWTQGFTPKLQQELTRTAAHAAGRFGHVMFPENVHQPAIDATRALLEGPGKGWASRVFYSDNGSTATEIGIKMAFRKFYVDAGFMSKDGHQRAKDLITEGTAHLPQLRIIALDGSYHGDTLGALDMQSPSVFTGPMQTPWYQPRGLFLQPPSLAIRHGEWTVALPTHGLLNNGENRLFADGKDVQLNTTWNTKAEAFNITKRLKSPLAKEYRSAIDHALERAEKDTRDGKVGPVGALVMEPVLHGAGGMILIDPLFQNILMKACRERNIPIVLDEVFAGIWRLGTEGAWEIIGEKPDISCYAKLLTGGLVPMSATLATADVFDAFYGPGKAQGLLHGHSYTAYPMGCAISAKALSMYRDPAKNPNLIVSKTSKDRFSATLTELWDESKLKGISDMSAVRRVIGQGCVLAVELEVEGDGGYHSNAAREVVLRLRRHGVQARPLGNVVYLMCSPTTPKEKCDALLSALIEELGR